MRVAILLALRTAAFPARFDRTPPRLPPHPPLRRPPLPPDKAHNCTERFAPQPVDHFAVPGADGAGGAGSAAFSQRYFTCSAQGVQWATGDPVFFYTGNENDVELYVHLTGLMWESAAAVNAKLVFAEHRYFGKSYPFSADGRFPMQDITNATRMQHLTVDLALADFSSLIAQLRTADGEGGAAGGVVSPYIAFGGSYGGMVATWLRMRYPHAVQGVIAGSAPIRAFEGMVPRYNPNTFAIGATLDASAAGGSPVASCTHTLRHAWARIDHAPSEVLAARFRLCPTSPRAAPAVKDWLVGAIGMMAMGSYPFPSDYMNWGAGAPLPPYPLRAACDVLTGAELDTDATLFARLRTFAAVFYNATGHEPCYDLRAATAPWMDLWSVLTCTSMVMPSGSSGAEDMFWWAPWNLTQFAQNCQASFGLLVRPEQVYWVAQNFGNSTKEWAARHSNIVWSNGELDPWTFGGIIHNVSHSLHALVIPDVGHHVDLMHQNPNDTAGTLAVRDFELRMIRRWVAEANRAATGEAVFV